jgi:hypothetical protein
MLPKESSQVEGHGDMSKETIILFKPYPFKVGQKLRISEGPRSGDWEVIGVGTRKVKLRCPVSRREFEWDRFCYFIELLDEEEWPKLD